jgi:hypothetical protein
MREAMEGARGVLGRPAGDKDKIRVARAMREV